MKIVSPKLSRYLENMVLNKDVVKNDLVDIEVINEEIEFDIENIEFNGCRFINVDFSKMPLKNIDLIDCIFEKCNLSGCDFSNRSIHRVRFDKCNMVGCNFILSSLKDVSILDTKANYINFSDSKLLHFEIKSSILKEGRFVSTSFDDVDFENVEFLNTKLKGIDFSTCNISNIGVSHNDIRGMIVNDSQALMLISLFGIVVK